MKFCIVILVGPGEPEVARLGHVLYSVFRFASNVEEIVLVDDSPTARRLEQRCVVPSHVQVTSLQHERHGEGPGTMGGMCMGMLQALRHLSTRTHWDAVLKIDTDALVISPFEAKLERLLASEPELGTAGVVERNCDGSLRDWEPYGSVCRRLADVFRLRRHPLLRRRITLFGHDAAVRRLVWQARRRGYQWGEHSQGGSYLVSQRLIERMRDAGFLSHGRAWLHLFMSEDAMMGLYARACGLRNVPFGGAGEVFGVGHIGLPLRPKDLIDRGYSIVHSIKNNPESEANLFKYFCENADMSLLQP